MKRIFLVAFAFVILNITVAKAENLDIRNTVWRSSLVVTNISDMVIASGSVTCFIDIQSAGSASRLYVYDGSMNGTTGILKQDIDSGSKTGDHSFVTTHSSGIVITATGDDPARFRVLWEWIGRAPLGHENDGR